jgi:hypothetical protein
MEMTHEEVLLWLIELGTDFVGFWEVIDFKKKHKLRVSAGKGLDNWVSTGFLERRRPTHTNPARFRLTEYALARLKDTYGDDSKRSFVVVNRTRD